MRTASSDNLLIRSDHPRMDNWTAKRRSSRSTPNRSATGVQRQADRQRQAAAAAAAAKKRSWTIDAQRNNGRGPFSLPRRWSRRPLHFLPVQSHSHGSSFQREDRGIVDRPTTSLPSPRPAPCAYYALTEILVCQWLALEDGNPGLSVAYAGRRKSGWTKGQQVAMQSRGTPRMR